LPGLPIDEMNRQLEDLYSQKCCEVHFPDLADDNMVDPVLKMLMGIWKDKGIKEGTINREVTRLFARTLWRGVKTAYPDFDKVDYDTPDWNMLASLQRDVWHFSGAKNYQELRQMTSALINEDGKLRSKSEFYEAAIKIHDQQIHYLRAEYDLAVAGSQMAGKWVDIEHNSSTLPYLEYDAVLDSQTTGLCTSLNGTVLPYNHSFWDRFYPPNHFGCRSTVRQRATGPQTPPEKIPSAEIPEMFQTNLGKQGLIFPKGHSFYVNIPEGIAQNTMAALTKELKVEAKSRLFGKQIKVEGVGVVEFNSKGIGKMFDQPHIQKMFKNQLAVYADQLLKNATLIKSAKNYDNEKLKVYYLKVKGLPSIYNLVVKERDKGKLILHSIVESIK